MTIVKMGAVFEVRNSAGLTVKRFASLKAAQAFIAA